MKHSGRAMTLIACFAGCLAIQVAAAQQPGASNVHEYKGKVVAAREAEMAPRIDALLDKIHFTAGQIVKEGELLFEFNPKQKQASLAMAQAKQKVMEAQLQLADVKLNNAKTLRARHVSSEMQLLEAQAQRDIAVANVEEARASVASAEFSLYQTKLFAPISGVISGAFIREGAYIKLEARDQTRMAVIIQLNPIHVVGEVPFDTYLQLRNLYENRAEATGGLEFALLLPNGQKYPHTGRFLAGTGEFNPETQVTPIAVEFPNPEYLLRPGLAITLRSSVREK